MLFNSVSFLAFFPVVFFTYYNIPHTYRRIFLLLASSYFYACFVPKYLFILFALITVDYFLGLAIADAEDVRKRKMLLIISIITNLGALIFFRYFNFLNENIQNLASFFHFNYSATLLHIILPLGLSFHVFQSLSYVIEVYRKKYTPEKSYITYALYVMFFPQLVAGPIERPQHLLPQLNITHTFNQTLARQGLERMLWGFFKKMVIADQIAQIIDPLYKNLPTESSLLFVIAILFSYQLYCDFSGYSDIAVGTAMMLGFNLQENFNRPYAAKTISDFWRRWHISLSNWLRDYLYYPLALSWGKGSRTKLYASSLITFILIGLWHGANWTFVIFGALHGIYLVLEAMTDKIRRKVVSIIHLDKIPSLYTAIQIGVIFLLVTISFIFFRSDTVSSAWWFITHLFTMPNINFVHYQLLSTLTSSVGTIVFLVLIVSICIMEIIQYYQAKLETFFVFDRFPVLARYGWYYFLTSMIIFFGYFGAQSFIYFQF